MRRPLILAVVVGGIWLTTFVIAFTVSEWRKNENSDQCQSAVAFFNAINSFTESEDRIRVASALLDDPATLDEEWDIAFRLMRERCT